jgi:ferredoxin-NADP reductase
VAHQVFTGPVLRFEPHTRRTRLLTLDVGGRSFAFHSGQAVWLRRTGRSDGKPYSIASAPADVSTRGVLEFLVGLEDDGEPGPHLTGVTVGSAVDVIGPLGGFDLPRSRPGSPVVLVGGGTGIAPLRSMWRHLLAHPDAPPISVIYSARSAADLAFLQELTALDRDHRIRLALTVTGDEETWAGPRGRLTDAALTAHVTRPADSRCAVCGPEAFVTHVSSILSRLGVASDHIATERF